MAILIKTANPQELLLSIKQAMDDRRVRDWTYNPEGEFTRTQIEAESKHWLRARIVEDTLVFKLQQSCTGQASHATFGVYHGRFIEMLFTHFRSKISMIMITPV